MSPPVGADLSPGALIGRYRIESPLGRGGMGGVYRATDTVLGRVVALKVVTPTGATEGPRFVREARSAAALSHPNVVVVHDVGEADGGVLFLAMELVDGATLRALAAGDAPWPERVRWLVDAARGLCAAHAAGLVHRDVKPDNVMVTRDGRVKVLDFGIARGPRVETPDGALVPTAITAKGAVVGTPLYMAPEQLRDEEVDPRSDQFAWGVMAYELLAGELPWSATDNAIALISRILSTVPPPLGQLRPELPAEVVAVVERAMAKDREARFPSMELLVEALASHAPAPTPAPGRDESRAPSTSPFAPTVAHPSTATRPRSRWLAAAVAAGLLAAGAAIVVVAARRSSTARAPALADAQPPGSSRDAAAAAAFAAGMQAWADGSSEVAVRHMQRATELDPTFAGAYLRTGIWGQLARFSVVGGIPADAGRHEYMLARDHRASANDYDRALIDAFEPRYQPEADAAEVERRFVVLAQRYPERGEVLYWLAWLRGDRGDAAGAREAAERAARLDHTLRPAVLVLEAWLTGDDLRASMPLLDLCSTLAPSAADCLGARARLQGMAGDCGAMEASAHAWVAADGEDPHAYLALAEALFAEGNTIESVRDALDALERRAPPDEVAILAPYHRIAVAVGAGDFGIAVEHAHTFAESPRASAGVAERYLATSQLALLALESGDRRAAAEATMAFLRRAPAWTAASPAELAMPAAIAALARRSGALSRAELLDERARWLRLASAKLDGATADERALVWMYGYALAAETPADAQEALAALAHYPPLLDPDAMAPYGAGLVGALYALAGDPRSAIPYLQRASSGCFMLNNVYAAVYSRLLLADALVEVGRREEAPALYRSVLTRWGHATPRSATADQARARLGKLGQ